MKARCHWCKTEFDYEETTESMRDAVMRFLFHSKSTHGYDEVIMKYFYELWKKTTNK